MASSISSNEIVLSWNSTSDPEVTGFLIEFTPAEGACEGIPGGNVSLGREATNHTLDGLEEFTEYDVTLRSRGVQGVGEPSPPVQAMTQQTCKRKAKIPTTPMVELVATIVD